MATETRAAAPTETRIATGSGVIPYRLTVRQYIRMIRANVFPEGAHVELLGGRLVAVTKHEPHDFCVLKLADRLRKLVPTGWVVREEKSALLGKFWRPEPDITVVRGDHDDYATRAPGGADIVLLIEVADSSYRKDARLKLRLYAAARIPTYWIVHLSNQQIEVYTDPAGRGSAARYQTSATFSAADSVAVTLDGRAVGQIAIADLFIAPPPAAGPSPAGP